MTGIVIKTFLKRLWQLLPILLIVSTIIFVITRMIPGDPALTMLGPQASADAIADLKSELGLDKNIAVQYLMYLKDVVRGDFGTSYSYHEPVASLILEKFPNTLLLSLFSLFLASLIGIPVGVISATKQYSMFDYVSMMLALVGVSMPIFWLGLMLVLVFSVNLGWLPALGMGSLQGGIGDVLRHLILPGVCIATIPMATFARITRASMLEVVHQDYIKALRARGIRESIIIWKHALKNAFPPILTVIGLQISYLLAGAILTETIFAWPGMGRMIFDAIENRDYLLIQGSVLFIAFIYVLINLLVDMVYMIVNPKVNYASTSE